MRFELRHMRAFIAVAEELQFRPAAERLHMTQSALTRTIQGLEEAVGAELLSRTTRVVQLTEAGRTFLYECRLALGHIEKASLLAQAAAEGKVGYLRIAYMDFAINGKLPMIIEKFLSTHPGIKVEPVRRRLEEYMAAQHGLPQDLRITDLGSHDDDVL